MKESVGCIKDNCLPIAHYTQRNIIFVDIEVLQSTYKLDFMSTTYPQDIHDSEKYETGIFFKMAKELYGTCAIQSEDLFRTAFKLTHEFSNITPKAVLADSRIIKILRYSMLPVISQMKLGQLVGLNTTSDFEDKYVEENTSLYKRLEKVAPQLCDLFNEYLDIQRFLWLSTNLNNDQKELAIDYSKNWTCSLISNQNSSTAFRNWRKELQETTAVEQLVRAGYTSIPKRKLISSIEDLLPGQFTRECRVQGINVQKADIVIRLKRSKKLLLIEAKAIGVRIDAFKRIKECREKFNDWRQAFGRNGAVYGAFLSGFIPESECRSINEDGGMIFWEHKNDLIEYVNNN